MKLESNDFFTLDSGATLMAFMHKGMDGVIYQEGGNSCHIYTGDTESGADMEIYLYDNLKIKVYGWRKGTPRIVLEGEEFPCTLELDKESMRNIMVVTKQRGEESVK